MNLDDIKIKIKSLLGRRVQLRVTGSRSRVELIVGEILAVYPNVFTVKVGNMSRSFTYSDVAIGDVVVYRV